MTGFITTMLEPNLIEPDQFTSKKSTGSIKLMKNSAENGIAIWKHEINLWVHEKDFKMHEVTFLVVRLTHPVGQMPIATKVIVKADNG
jgi:hypothetical protein